MITLVRSFIVVLLLIISGCSGGGSSGTGGIELKGTTINENSTPIPNVTIDVFDLNNNPIASTTSSSNGSFSLPNLIQREGRVEARFPSTNRTSELNYAVPLDRSIAVVTFRKRRDGTVNSSIRYPASRNDDNDEDDSDDRDDDNDDSDDDENDDDEDPIDDSDDDENDDDEDPNDDSDDNGDSDDGDDDGEEDDDDD